MASYAVGRTAPFFQAEAVLEEVCVTHGIEFHRGMLQARRRSGDELARVVTRVAQAALRISRWGELAPYAEGERSPGRR